MKKDVFRKSPFRSLKHRLYNPPCSACSNVFNPQCFFPNKSLFFTVPPAVWTIRESTFHFKLGEIYIFFIFFWCISARIKPLTLGSCLASPHHAGRILIQKTQNVLHLFVQQVSKLLIFHQPSSSSSEGETFLSHVSLAAVPLHCSYMLTCTDLH